MPIRVKSYVSLMVLAGTSVLILQYLSPSNFFAWPKTAFRILCLNSCLGIAKYCFQWNNVDGIFHYSKPLESIFVYPLFVGQIWLNTGYRDFAMLHPICAFIPYIQFLNEQDYVQARDVVIIMNMLSCLVISFDSGNGYGILITILVAFEKLERWNEFSEEEQRDIYNYLMCAFEIFAVNAVGTAES